MNVWGSLISLGDVFALLVGQIVMKSFGLDWSIFVIIFCVFIFSSGWAFYYFLEDVEDE